MPNLGIFRQRVAELMRSASPFDDGSRPRQADLASAIGLSRAAFNRRLNASAGHSLSERDVRAIVRTLCDWGAITTRAEAEELLTYAGVASFSEAQWQSPPLDLLSSAAQGPTASPAAVISHPIPAVPHAVGRLRELEALAHTLNVVGTAQIVPASSAVLGLAGIGKTTLAALYCRRYARAYEAIIWRDLRVDASLRTLMGVVAQLVGESFDPARVRSEDDQALLVASWLSKGANYLLVLDNCESILDQNGNPERGWASLLAHEELGHSRVLITSRQHIQVNRRRLTGCELLGLSEAEGQELLSAAGLGNIDKTTQHQIIKLAGGHPLALILFAQLVTLDHYPAAQLLTSDLWGEELATLLLSEVYNKLATDEQLLLHYLSVFNPPQGFRQPVSAAEVAAMLQELQPPIPGWSAAQVALLATSLHRRSLVEVRDGRYSLHEIVRDYSYRQLRSAETYHLAAARSFQNRYLATSAANPAGISDVISLLYSFEHYLAAADYIAAYSILFDLAVDHLGSGDKITLSEQLDRWGEYQRLQSMTHDLEAASSGQLDPVQQANVLMAEGAASRNLGQLDHSEAALSMALEVAERSGNAAVRARVLGNLGTHYLLLEQFEKAIGYYQQAKIEADALGDQRGSMKNMGNIGFASQQLGRYDEALQYYREVLTAAEVLGDAFSRGYALGNLGITYLTLQDYTSSSHYLVEAVSIAEAMHDQRSQPYWWHYLGASFHAAGRNLEALACYLKALALYTPHAAAFFSSGMTKTEASIAQLKADLPGDEWDKLYTRADMLASIPDYRPVTD